MQALRDEPFLSKFAVSIECTSREAADEIDRLLAIPDHHDVPRELAFRLGISEEAAVFRLVSSLAPTTHPDLENVREVVQAMFQQERMSSVPDAKAT